MSTRAPNTNTNLVLNGHFNENYEHWEDLVNPGGVDIKRDWWQGEYIKFMTLTNRASVAQTLSVPADRSAEARYHLSFLYETLHGDPGSLKISKEGGSEEIEIPLPATRPPQGGGEPLELDLTELTIYLDLDIRQDDYVRVTLVSPRNASGDYVSHVRFARIGLHLELAPPQFERLIRDNMFVTPDEPLYLCLGATGADSHVLRFESAEGSAWLGTEGALWSEDNPQQAIITSPALGVNQSIDESWTVDCPDMAGDEVRLFTLELYSKYTADPYPIAVSLGHHRLAVEVVQEAAYYPVLEYEESVRLGVQVSSYYTGQPMADQEVSWQFGDEVLHRCNTDGEGKAWFDYKPTEAGAQVIETHVASPYYENGDVVQTLEVHVLASDPWKELTVSFQDHSMSGKWGEQTGYLERGESLQVSLQHLSDFWADTQLTLFWDEGDLPDDLDVTATPDFGTPVDITGNVTDWILGGGDLRNGQFSLVLSCSRLLRRSHRNAMSLGYFKIKIGQVREANKSPVVDEGDSVTCMVQVVSLKGQPVPDKQVNWVGPRGTVTSYTSLDGWASVIDSPNDAGNYTITAQVRGHEDSSVVEHVFQITALATSEWKRYVKFYLDGTEVDRATLGVVCLRGQSHVLRLQHTLGSPFLASQIALDWRDGVDPKIGLVVDPDMRIPRALPSEGLEWKITSGTDISGLFELQVQSTYIPEKRELSGRLLASDLTQEATSILDQRSVALGSGRHYPCLGAIHHFAFLTSTFSPLHGLELELSLAPMPSGLIITPPLSERQIVSAGGARWQFDFSAVQARAEMRLGFRIIGLESDILLKLDHNKLKLGDVRNAAIDPVLSKEESVRLEARYLSFFTQQSVEEVQVQWSSEEMLHTRSKTRSDGWAGHDFLPPATGLNQVKAVVFNPYDETQVTETFEVNALSTDPWLDLLVDIDGQTSLPWAQRPFFARREKEFTFRLRAHEGSALHRQNLTLGIKGTGPAELALEVGPVAPGIPRLFTGEGLPCTLKAGNIKDGGFSFQLAASRLLERSPLNVVSLGTASQVIKIKAMDSVLQVIDWGTEFNVSITLVSAVNGEPLVGITVVWESPDLGRISTTTNFYGVANVRFVPVTVGLDVLTATAGDELHSDSISLPFTLSEPREIQSLSSPKPSGHLGELVSAVVTVVSARTGEPLQDVEVKWKYPDRIIAPTRTDAEGNARVSFRLSGIREGVLQASVTGGYGGWDMKSMVFTLLPAQFAITVNGVEES